MYVALSKELRESLNQRIIDMKDAEVESSVPKDRAAIKHDLSALITRIEFGEHLDILEHIPKKWLRRPEDGKCALRVYFKHPYGDGRHEFHLKLSNVKNAFFCPRPDGYPYTDPVPITCEEDLLALPENTPGRDVVLSRIADRRTALGIEHRWERIKNDIDSILDGCKSLNEAVELVPGLKLYLAEDYLERLERKNQRAARKQVQLNIDVEAIVAAGVAAKLSNAV
jgi:hypothetical protein